MRHGTAHSSNAPANTGEEEVHLAERRELILATVDGVTQAVRPEGRTQGPQVLVERVGRL